MKNTNADNITDKAFALSLTISMLGNRRKISAATVADPEKEFNRDMIGVSKQLLDSAEYKAIRSFDGETKRWLYAHSLPCMFTGHGGIYMIPTGLFTKVYDTLTERAEQRQALVEKFISVYPQLVADAKTKLGPILFNESDYPDVEELEASFGMRWMVTEFKTPEALSTIRKEIFEREKKKAETQWKSVADEAKESLRFGFAKLIERITERLSDPGKKFKDSLVSNISEFIETFPYLNVTNDLELQAQVKKASTLINGLDPDDLRKSLDTRKSILDGMLQIESKLDTMITDRPKRRILAEDAA